MLVEVKQARTDPKLHEFLASYLLAADEALARGIITHKAQLFWAYLSRYASDCNKSSVNYELGKPGMLYCPNCGRARPRAMFDLGHGKLAWQCSICRLKHRSHVHGHEDVACSD